MHRMCCCDFLQCYDTRKYDENTIRRAAGGSVSSVSYIDNVINAGDFVELVNKHLNEVSNDPSAFGDLCYWFICTPKFS